MAIIKYCILILLVTLCQAEKYIRQKSDTLIKVEANPTKTFNPCTCNGGKCTANSTLERKVCGEILYHLREQLQPIPQFFRCQMNEKTCSDPKSKKLFFELLVDQDEMTQQPFYQGQKMTASIVSKVLTGPTVLYYSYVDMKSITTTAETGISASPVILEAALNVNNETGNAAVACWGLECSNVVNDVCSSTMKNFKEKIANFDQVLVGCRVSRIYEIDGAYRITYAMMIDYPKAVNKKLFNGEDELRKKFQTAIKEMKLPKTLKSLDLAGASLKSYCEYQAETISQIPYYGENADPSSRLSILLAMRARSKIAEQLGLGQMNNRLCLGEITDVQMSESKQLTKYDVHLGFSTACIAFFKKVNTCSKYMDILSSEWKQGDTIQHFPEFPKFDFKALSA